MAGKKILVADDSLTIQKVIRLALSGDGYEIQTVSDGKEALEQASLFRPDICILDVSLPLLDAYQLRESFLAKPDLAGVPVILMSSAFEKVDETRAKNLGFSGHLVKPFDPSHLRSTLLSVAQQAPRVDPVAATIHAPPTPASPFHFDPPADLPPLTSDAPTVDDVQMMAQNTFEMSGMSQHEWGMIEPGRAPSLPATPSVPEPHPEEVVSIDFTDTFAMRGGADLPSPTPGSFSVSPQELEQMIRTEVEKAIATLKQELQSKTESEIKQWIHSQVPALAEKLLKDQIHQLLSEPPV